jgi:hypothetical protein
MKEEKIKSGREDEKGQVYCPPVLRVVELATDEVLGVGCKSASDVAPTGLCGTTSCGNQIGS